ncbi:MAG TPA: hypothetical protein VLX92_16590 [Kofleriaceae bacterium]|nr:hypothetical protein [Kofleriaceae bacterium]
MGKLAIVAVLCAIASAPARADDHLGQVGLSMRFGLGVRGILPYDHTVYCGTADATAQYGNAAACASRVPFTLGFEASYGVGRHVDLLVELGLGLERDFGGAPGQGNGPRPLFVSPGARFFFGESKNSRLFLTTQLLVDLEDFKDANGKSRGTDYGVRGLEGYWIDLHRAYGFYLYIGETAEFARWLEGAIEGGVGFQGRYP